MVDDLSKKLVKFALSKDDWNRINLLTNEQRLIEYRTKGEEAWNVAWQILHTDGWKLEAGKSAAQTGSVHSLKIPNIGKIFKLEGIVDCSPVELYKELVERVADTPKWNPTVIESKIIQVVDNCTDICYNVSPPLAGGLIASRDFVNVRHWKSYGNVILSSGCSVSHPDVAATNLHIRGETRPGGWVFTQIDGNPNSCLFNWLIGTDLKGWIPQYVVDAAFSKTLLEFLHHVQKRVAENLSPINITCD